MPNWTGDDGVSTFNKELIMAKTKKTRKTIVGKRNGRNRDRGKEFEREVANEMFKVFPRATRSFGQSATGNEAPDVVGTPFWIECGKGKTIRAEAKFKQAVESWGATAYTGAASMRPIAVTTKGGRGAEVLVTMRLDDFMEILELVEDEVDRLFGTQ